MAGTESLSEESCQSVGNRFKTTWKIDGRPKYVAVNWSGSVYVTAIKTITTTLDLLIV